GHFGRAPIKRVGELPPQHAVPVDDIGLRNLDGSVHVLDLGAGVAHGHKIHSVLADEPVVSAVILIRADRHHDHTLVLHLLLHAHQRRRLGYARRAPAGPEIQHHHLSLELAQSDPAFGVLHHKVRRGFANSWWARASVAAGKQYQAKQGDGKEDTSHLAIIIDSPYVAASTSLGPAGFR